jgi:hypothetical protein
MPEAEMKHWSHMWVQHTAALVILYQVSTASQSRLKPSDARREALIFIVLDILLYRWQERLSFELCQLEESEVVNEEEVQEVRAVLHAMLENGKRELRCAI